MKTTRSCDWQELASRNNDGLAISLLWNKAEGRVKLSITDSRCDETFELGLAGEDALTAFNHPFAFAALPRRAFRRRAVANPSTCSCRAERGTDMSPLKHSKNFAARMGRWSASHWKTAVAGWLAFVALSVFVGMQVGTTQIDRNDANVGESRTADQIISDAGFAVDENGESIDEQGEMVLLQSKTLTVNDAAFRVAIADTVKALQAFPKVTKLRSPLAADHADLVSKDSHSALIQFTPTGTYDEVVLYIDTILSAVDRVQAAHTGFYIHSAGVSTDKALDKEIQGGLGKAGLISIPLTILILMIVLGSLVGAMIPLLVALSAIAATTGLLALSSQAIPASDSIMEVILLIGLAVGVDYSLFYMRREREERRAGRSATAALEAAAATSGRAVLISGITVLIAMAGMFLTGDKTFMSFSVGAMLVVAVAMIGSLTVLPAVLGKLGDGVERGRIPFVHRLGRQQGDESRLECRPRPRPSSSSRLGSRLSNVAFGIGSADLQHPHDADGHRRHHPVRQSSRSNESSTPFPVHPTRQWSRSRPTMSTLQQSARRSITSNGRLSRPAR